MTTAPPSSADRVLAPSRALERGEIPELAFAGVFEYTVVTATPLGISCNPTIDGMPPIQLAPGGQIGPTTLLAMNVPGTKVLVSFVNMDPSRPFVWSVTITSTMLVDSTMANSGGPVTISTPIVATLTAP